MPTAKELKEKRDKEAENAGEIEVVSVSRDDVPTTPEAMEIMEKIGREFDQAETVQQILQGGQTTAVEEIIDRRVILHGYELRDSSEYDGPFAIIDTVDEETGEVMAVACGGFLVLRQLKNFDRLDAWPVGPLRFGEAGRAFRLFEPVDKRTIETKAK